MPGARAFDGRTAAPTLPGRWAERWRGHGQAPALVLPAERRTISAAELEQRSADVARLLGSQGLGPGDRALWAPEPSLASVAAAVAVLRIGAVLVPTYPRISSRELDQVVDEVRPRLALRGAGAVEVLTTAAGGRAGHGARARGRRRSADRAGGDPDPVLDAADPSHPAVIIYTSGTTGRPKGAVLSHANLAAGSASVRRAWRWTEDDRLTLALPFFHVHGLCIGLFGTLDAGASAVLLPAFDPGQVLAAGADHGATLFFGVPTMYHRLAQHGRADALGRLRLCVSGSAPLAAELWQELRRCSGASVLERYGMTETLLILSNPYDGERRPGTVGMALPGASYRITEPMDGDVGELEVRGPTVFTGYWGQPEATEACRDGAWFDTGDLASCDDEGYVAIRGRKRELIITGGHNVYPAEVEDALLSHPGVREAAATGMPSAEWGEEVVAWVVSDGSVDEAGLLDHAAVGLTPYKRPLRVHLVESLPRNPMGKVQRSRLVEEGRS